LGCYMHSWIKLVHHLWNTKKFNLICHLEIKQQWFQWWEWIHQPIHVVILSNHYGGKMMVIWHQNFMKLGFFCWCNFSKNYWSNYCCNFFARHDIFIERLLYLETQCYSPFHGGKSLGGMCLACKRLHYDTSICERNWSIWNQVQTKKRNRLSMK
jgi:hypothetical protein